MGTGPGPGLIQCQSIDPFKFHIIAYPERNYVGTGPGPEWVTVYYVKPSHCNLRGNFPFPHKFCLNKPSVAV